MFYQVIWNVLVWYATCHRFFNCFDNVLIKQALFFDDPSRTNGSRNQIHGALVKAHVRTDNRFHPLSFGQFFCLQEERHKIEDVSISQPGTIEHIPTIGRIYIIGYKHNPVGFDQKTNSAIVV